MKFSRHLKLLPIPALMLASTNLIAQSASTQPDGMNPYSPAVGHRYRHGVYPTRETHAKMQSWAAANKNSSAGTAITTRPQTLSFSGGNIISGTPVVYLVVMGTQWGVSTTNPDGNLALSNDPVGAVPY